MIDMSSEYGTYIREQFPEHSPLHDDNNPMREMIETGIGTVFDEIEEEIFDSSDMRFLITATGKYLDLMGERFGLARGTRTDDEYRAVLIAIKSSTPSIAGIKRTISKILDISIDEVVIIQGVESGCHDLSVAADNYEGTACQIIDGYIPDTAGTITVKIPLGSGIDVLEPIISNFVIASVTVILKEYTAL